MRADGNASNTLWPRDDGGHRAVQNLLGGDEAMASRKPEVYADAAVIVNKPATEYAGKTLLCEDVLVESGADLFTTASQVRRSASTQAEDANPPGYLPA